MGKKNKVIIVDDDEDLLRLLISAFKAKGFETQEFTRGQEALRYLMEEKNIEDACLLILDRLLPDAEGLEILQKFMDKFDSKVPILVVSALSAEKDILEGLKKGAVDYIGKPFSLPILMQKSLFLIGRNV